MFPFDQPLAPEPGDNQALAVNTRTGRSQYDVALALVWVEDGEDALNTNEAYAFASCDTCAAVAVAFQVVMVIGDNDVAAPQNLAGAVNYDCVNCLTYALAQQLFITLDGPLSEEATGPARRDLDRRSPPSVRASPSIPLDQIDDKLDEFEQQILDVIETDQPGTVPRSSPGADPSGTATAGTTGPSPTAGGTTGASPSAGTTTGPSPTSTPAGPGTGTATTGPTSSPTAGQPSPTAGPTTRADDRADVQPDDRPDDRADRRGDQPGGDGGRHHDRAQSDGHRDRHRLDRCRHRCGEQLPDSLTGPFGAPVSVFGPLGISWSDEGSRAPLPRDACCARHGTHAGRLGRWRGASRRAHVREGRVYAPPLSPPSDPGVDGSSSSIWCDGQSGFGQ